MSQVILKQSDFSLHAHFVPVQRGAQKRRIASLSAVPAREMESNAAHVRDHVGARRLRVGMMVCRRFPGIRPFVSAIYHPHLSG
jgi:hypothetical protein